MQPLAEVERISVPIMLRQLDDLVEPGRGEWSLQLQQEVNNRLVTSVQQCTEFRSECSKAQEDLQQAQWHLKSIQQQHLARAESLAAELALLEGKNPTKFSQDGDDNNMQELCTRYKMLVDRQANMQTAVHVMQQTDELRQRIVGWGAPRKGLLDARVERTMQDVQALLALSSGTASQHCPVHNLLAARCQYLRAAIRRYLSQAFAAAFEGVDPMHGSPAHDAEALHRVKMILKLLLELQGNSDLSAVWALDQLLQPVVLRFRYHFEEERPTNRQDRPEWFFAFLTKALKAYTPLLEDHIRPLQRDRWQDPSMARTAMALDCVAYFTRGLVLLARKKVRLLLDRVLGDDLLLSHLLEQALGFERALEDKPGYSQFALKYPWTTWPRVVHVLTAQPERYERWVQVDRDLAESKFADFMGAPTAWAAVGWQSGGPRANSGGSLAGPTTHCAREFVGLFQAITERYRVLHEPRDPSSADRQLQFVRRMQKPLLQAYYAALYKQAKECDIMGLFRTAASDLGPRWEAFCLVVSSCAHVMLMLRDTEDDMFFAGLQQVVAQRLRQDPALAAKEPARRLLAVSAVEAVVGSAVDGVSGALTSVANRAETVTEGVVKAVGAEGTIIGPTRAFSAALGGIKKLTKGTARYVGGALPRPVEGGAKAGQASPRGLQPHSGDGGAGLASPRASQPHVQEEEPGPVDGSNITKVAAEAADSAVPFSLGALSVFADETAQYRQLLDAMLEDAVDAVTEGFRRQARPYLRMTDQVFGAAQREDHQPSELLGPALALLDQALGVARRAMDAGSFHAFWPALASELDVSLSQLLVDRNTFTEGGGQQLQCDVEAINRVLARHMTDRTNSLKALREAALLLSLPNPQLKSLETGLVALGAYMEDEHAVGLLESPEHLQMENMLENVGVRRLIPAQAIKIIGRRIT